MVSPYCGTLLSLNCTYIRTYVHTYINTYIRTVHMIRSIIPYFLNTYHDDLTKRTSQHHHRRRSHHHHHPSLRRTMSDRLVARMGGSVIKYTRFHVCESERHSFVPTSQLNVASAQMGGGHAEYTRLCTCSPGRPSENREQIHDEQGTIASRVCRRACLPSLTPDAAVIPLTLVALVHRHNAWT